VRQNRKWWEVRNQVFAEAERIVGVELQEPHVLWDSEERSNRVVEVADSIRSNVVDVNDQCGGVQARSPSAKPQLCWHAAQPKASNWVHHQAVVSPDLVTLGNLEKVNRKEYVKIHA